jgi:hypothetical protein
MSFKLRSCDAGVFRHWYATTFLTRPDFNGRDIDSRSNKSFGVSERLSRASIPQIWNLTYSFSLLGVLEFLLPLTNSLSIATTKTATALS